MTIDKDLILEKCNENPLFANANALNRTIICYLVITEAGIPVPGWEGLREIIGKGSSTDILKGVASARMVLASRLKAAGALPEGFPPAIVEPMREVWSAAQRLATEQLADDRLALQAQALAGAAAVAAAEARAMRLESELAGKAAEIEALKTASAAHQAQLDTEKSAAQSRQSQLAAQIDNLRSDKEALVRLQEADRARADAAEQDRRSAMLRADSAFVETRRLRAQFEVDSRTTLARAEAAEHAQALAVADVQALRAANDLLLRQAQRRSRGGQLTKRGDGMKRRGI